MFEQDYRLALWCAPRRVRDALAAIFELDLRLSAMRAAAREPMLADIRMAWWATQLDTIADLEHEVETRITSHDPLLQKCDRLFHGTKVAPHLFGLTDDETRILALFECVAAVCGHAPCLELEDAALAYGHGERGPRLGISPLDLLLNLHHKDSRNAARGALPLPDLSRNWLALRFRLIGC